MADVHVLADTMTTILEDSVQLWMDSSGEEKIREVTEEWLTDNVDGKIESVIDRYDFTGDIEREIGDFDFTGPINSALEDYDFSDDIEVALSNYPMERYLSQAVSHYIEGNDNVVSQAAFDALRADVRHNNRQNREAEDELRTRIENLEATFERYEKHVLSFAETTHDLLEARLRDQKEIDKLWAENNSLRSLLGRELYKQEQIGVTFWTRMRWLLTGK